MYTKDNKHFPLSYKNVKDIVITCFPLTRINSRSFLHIKKVLSVKNSEDSTGQIKRYLTTRKSPFRILVSDNCSTDAGTLVYFPVVEKLSN